MPEELNQYMLALTGGESKDLFGNSVNSSLGMRRNLQWHDATDQSFSQLGRHDHLHSPLPSIYHSQVLCAINSEIFIHDSYSEMNKVFTSIYVKETDLLYPLVLKMPFPQGDTRSKYA
jgi:hypothetical protein